MQMNATAVLQYDNYSYYSYSYYEETAISQISQPEEIIIVVVNLAIIISSLAVVILHFISNKGRSQTGRCLLALLMTGYLLRNTLDLDIYLASRNFIPSMRIICEIVYVLLYTLLSHQYIIVLLLVIDNYLRCTRGETLAKKTAVITIIVTFIAILGMTIGIIIMDEGFVYVAIGYGHETCFLAGKHAYLVRGITGIAVSVASVVFIVKTCGRQNGRKRLDDPKSAGGENAVHDQAENKTTGWAFWKQCVLATASISSCASLLPIIYLILTITTRNPIFFSIWYIITLLLELLFTLLWLIPFVLVKGGCLRGSSDEEQALLMK